MMQVGWLKTGAHPDEWCPKCQACNPNDTQISVWLVSEDGSPLRLECDQCAHSWLFEYGKDEAVVPAAGTADS